MALLLRQHRADPPAAPLIIGADRGTCYTIPPIQNIKINPWTLLSTLKEDMPEAMPVVFDLHTTLANGQPSVPTA